MVITSMPPPRASQWTHEKSACIDWADPSEVLANALTFMQLLSFHPPLEAHLRAHPAERDAYKSLFGSPDRHEEQHTMLREWNEKGLLVMRTERWCRCCGREGHTRRHCQQAKAPASQICVSPDPLPSREPVPTATVSSTTRPLTAMDKYFAHCQEVEKRKLVAEKQSRQDNIGGKRGQALYGGAVANSRHVSRATALEMPGAACTTRQRQAANAVEEPRRRGVVVRLDVANNVGFVRVADLGEVKFFADRVDCGVKAIAEGDAVTFAVDCTRDYPMAVEVRHEKSIVSLEDTRIFLERCQRELVPMRILAALLTHKHEWFELLNWVRVLLTEKQVSEFRKAVHALVQIVTFVENREAIHLPLLEAFLLLTTSPGRLDSERAFFPDLVHTALERDVGALPSALSSPSDPLLVEQWIEVADYVVLLRQHTCVTLETVAPTQKLLETFLLANSESTAPISRKVRAALRRLADAAVNRVRTLLIPSATELSIPSDNPASVFHAHGLPVLDHQKYTGSEDFLMDHCKLLRADTFELTSRLLPAVCFSLPSYIPSPETAADVEHARLYWRVRFMGQVVTRDRDYKHPISYVVQVQPKDHRANIKTQLNHGAAVCITTGLDRTKMDDSEIFWGVVSASNKQLLKAGMVVLTPMEGSASFERLVACLARNESLGHLEHSMLLETPIFIAGYVSILKALCAFVGPMAMPLPMAERIMHPAAAVVDTPQETPAGSSTPMQPIQLIPYVPLHCERAFRELTENVRRRFALDAGQDMVMRQLPTSRILLVQGPPGTGKSFIGCRVVETYVRYKQLVASGDILQKVDIDTLHSTRPEDLLPRVGPIVVITYKNHALDEFLVDLLRSGLWDTSRADVGSQLANGAVSTGVEHFPSGQRLVRIGGRSREQRLEGYNLSALLRAKSDKLAISNLKDRLYRFHQALDRWMRGIRMLEAGEVPAVLFSRWLTEEQKQHMRPEDREEWLAGGRYIGITTQRADPQLYLTIVRSKMAEALNAAARTELLPASPTEALEAGRKDCEAEDISLSVFQQMKQEDEAREMNDALHSLYLSSEALQLAKEPPTRPAEVPNELLSLWSLDPVTRHEYYAYLIQSYVSAKARSCLAVMENLKNVVSIRNHALDEAKLSILRGADVVGLTTTGCAMNQNILRSLRPSVLVVEEAAEVLEAQLLACMTDSLTQIVLIGDHYQLQPKVETYQYEKINHLNKSLFQRLAEHMQPIRLTEQRRMHPALSRLVRPFYSPQPLLDHPMLLERPFITASGEAVMHTVPGLVKRAFFWRHAFPEEEAPGSRSKVNMRELRMVQMLVTHLVAQGVMQRSIAVLTPYLGQCRMLRNVVRLSSLPDIRVSTVDLYQGDENDVIVLSLVRTSKLTDFIRMRNRLIVSCSRARFAMVIVGNDELLRQCAHWKDVIERLEAEGCVSDRLPVSYRDTPGDNGTLSLEGHGDVAALSPAVAEAISMDMQPQPDTIVDGVKIGE